jgi:protein-tyrosine phosphatase
MANRFIDLHSHFVFGLDDGARSLEESLAMLEQAAESGIEHVLATPHATELTDDRFSEQVLRQFRLVQDEARKKEIPVRLSLGAELFFSRRLMEWLRYPWATVANNQKYLLFELPLFDLPDGVGEFIFECRLKGITPILAHPERYLYLHKKLEKLYSFFQQGCLIQINAGSIVGQFGQSVQEMALRFVKANFVHFVASDAHETRQRNYKVLLRSYEELQKTVDDATLNKWFYENPAKALQGGGIEPGDVDETFFNNTQKSPMKKWAKLLKNRFLS